MDTLPDLNSGINSSHKLNQVVNYRRQDVSDVFTGYGFIGKENGH